MKIGEPSEDYKIQRYFMNKYGWGTFHYIQVKCAMEKALKIMKTDKSFRVCGHVKMLLEFYILHTEEYKKFCDKFIGKFIDYKRYDGEIDYDALVDKYPDPIQEDVWIINHCNTCKKYKDKRGFWLCCKKMITCGDCIKKNNGCEICTSNKDITRLIRVGLYGKSYLHKGDTSTTLFDIAQYIKEQTNLPIDKMAIQANKALYLSEYDNWKIICVESFKHKEKGIHIYAR